MMKQIEDSFLNSTPSIRENQTEYSMLTDLFYIFDKNEFLLELPNLKILRNHFAEIKKFIRENCKSYNISSFCLTEVADPSGGLTHEEINESLNRAELLNRAMNISAKNESYVVVKSKDSLELINKGRIDPSFNEVFRDKNKLQEIESQLLEINDLELVFDNFQSRRKHKGCDYIRNKKVISTIKEQDLRNHLGAFLKQTTKLQVIFEFCTSMLNDEESVDISLINADNEISIIEVKFFIEKKFFENERGLIYYPSRFKDGYEQLSKYCEHLKKDKHVLHSMYLYMFYAHSKTEDVLRTKAEEYKNAFLNEQPSDKTELFNTHFKKTIFDNIIDFKS